MERLSKPKDRIEKNAMLQRLPLPAHMPATQADTVLQLQSTLGNRRVNQMIQAKRLPTLQRTPGPLIQRFDTKEHALLGDEGGRNDQGQVRDVILAPDYSLTYGEMTAMAGDFFGSIQEMRSLATAKSHKGVGTREELEYVRVCKVRAKDDADKKAKANLFSDDVKTAVDKRYYALALNNRSHFQNPTSDDELLTVGQKIEGADATKRKAWAMHYPIVQKDLPNAVVGYHQHHVEALYQAYQAGLEGKDYKQALAVEAFGSHYLTDSFSGGHLRTNRADISSHWNKRVPMFNFNLKGYIANVLARHLDYPVSVDWIYSMDNPVKKGSLAIVTQKLDAKGGITFGDVVSGALHDYDNKYGAPATIQGKDVLLHGDSHLGEGDEKKSAITAVNAGIQDILKAWEAGQKKADYGTFAESLKKEGLFTAESLIPTVKGDSLIPNTKIKHADGVETDRRSVLWNYDNVGDLLQDEKFKLALNVFAQEQAGEFAKVAADLDEKQRPVFEKHIVKRLRNEPLVVIKEVIDWVPDTGGGLGGHNQDDNALEYLELARDKNALHTLTIPQKVKLLRFLFDGATTGYDERILMEMINAKPKDVPELVRQVGWDRMEDELGSAFSKKYPRSMFAAKTR